MMPRRAVAAAAAALLLTATLGVTACMPEPEPTPTPTGFASEAEAFAAAEETYRAYVDALNQVDLSDPATFEPVFAWTTGEANANERETLSRMHADGWTKTGLSELIAYTGGNADISTGRVDGVACVDVSTINVVDPSGASVVPPERPDQYSLEVVMTSTTTSPTGLRIASSSALEGGSCEG